MKNLLFILALLGSTSLFAQMQNEKPLLNDFAAIQKNIEKQNIEFKNLEIKLGKQSSLIEKLSKEVKDLEIINDSLSILTGINQSNITSIAKDFRIKIQTSETSVKEDISKLDKNVEFNRLYWIIGTLVTLLIGGIVYWLLVKRIAANQTDVETQIRNTKISLEEESLKLDVQLLEIINSQLKVKENEAGKTENGEKDHSLVLKVADEVTRILMNLEVMDKEIKGYKQLKKYSESILDNLKAYGYEIPRLIGMNYNSGMNMDAKLELDESVEIGKQIIKRIIKPQVNFGGKMIQAAKVTVAFNE